MLRKNIIASLLLCASISGFAMTDQEVISFIKQQAASGVSQQQIGQDLLSRGVTPEQAERIRATYTGGSTNASAVRASASVPVSETVIMPVATNDAQTEAQRRHNANSRIYGHDLFASTDLFAPNENMATPQNYKLGPGDEVIIDIWGANEEHLRQTISPEGSIMIEQLGPVYLNGMTINDAGKYIKSQFSKKYAGMNDEETDIQLTLGQVRSIQVNVLGEVGVPGSFQVSPFTSVLNALYTAGGVGDLGSIRNIQVLRNGKKIAGVDIYELLTKGTAKGNIILEEGDVIIVPPYQQLVNIQGNVKRPMVYEMLPGETIETLVNYAGGYSSNAYSGAVTLTRRTGTENELFNVERAEFVNYPLQDGDVISVGTILDRYSNSVEIGGAVFRPGQYALNQNVSTVAELIAAADGLVENAYKGRALLYRQGPELQLQVMALDLGEILSGAAPDIMLQKNDRLIISTIEQIQNRGTVSIQGQVDNPGSFPFAENMTLEDLILAAGGLREGASTARVDISRRIYDPEATEATQQTAQLFEVSIDKSLKKGTGVNFKLEPYDLVQVRLSPGYEVQRTVTIDGEILFAGAYAIEKRNERITDIINRAGGILDGAYIKGAYLERQLTQSEYEARQETLRIARMNSVSNGGDSIAFSKIDISRTYNVGIDLQMALDNPGSSYDLVIQEGDRLFIPQMQSTVKIGGDVLFPNAVLYVPGKKLKYYINQAGGYGSRAKKNKAFIVYMNGTVTVAKRNTKIEPGCQIIVPSKPAPKGTDWAQILALTSSVTSVASLAAAITSIVR